MNRLTVFSLILLFGVLFATPAHAASSRISSRDSVLRFSAGGGFAFSTINMRMEPLGQLKQGWNLKAGLRLRRRIGITGEYTYQLRHDAIPAWEHIMTRNVDLNLTYLYFNVSDSETKFYAINGVCIQKWTGIYKGPAAVNQDNIDYVPGDVKVFTWFSLNAGIGFERYYKYFGLFAEFKFRVGKNNPSDPVGIVDVGGTLGAKINLITVGGKSRTPETGNRNRSKRHLIKPKVYHWF